MKIVSSSGKGDFKLIEENKVICELVYENWFSGKAKTIIVGNKIEIKPKNIWTSKVDIFKNENKIGDISFSLKGYMVISLVKPNGTEISYVLKNKDKWKLQFGAYNENEILQFSMVSANNWKKLNYNYYVEMAEYDSSIKIEELLIYMGYAANLYLAIINAV